MEEKTEGALETAAETELPSEDAQTPEEIEATTGKEKPSEEAEEEIFEKEDVEEEAPPSRKEEEEFVEERIYTIPLQRAWIMPPKKRTPKAIRIIKAFVKKHMKVGEVIVASEGDEKEEGGRLIISNEVNEKIWSRGIEKPPRKLTIRAAKDEEGNVTIFLA